MSTTTTPIDHEPRGAGRRVVRPRARFLGAVAVVLAAMAGTGALAIPSASASSYFNFSFGSSYASSTGNADASAVSAAFGWRTRQLDVRARRIVFTYTEQTAWQSHCAGADGAAFTVAHETDLSAPIAAAPVRARHHVAAFQLHGVASTPAVRSTLEQIGDVPNGGCPAGSTFTGSGGSTEVGILASYRGVTVQVV